MQRILTGFALAALLAVIPTVAQAGNREMAEQIAQNLRDSGQTGNYKIGVKFQDGTAWVRGQVADEAQMSTALRVAFQTPGVTRVVNELTLASDDPQSEPAQTSAQPSSNGPAPSWANNPLRSQEAAQAQTPRKDTLVKRLESLMGRGSEQADRVASSYGPASVQTVSAQEPQEEMPQQMAAPQRARPMAPQYVAMQQDMRGPTAPNGGPVPMYRAAAGPGGVAPARYDQPCMPNYAWPSYAAYPNYAAVTYPKQYSPTAWPYIGPFYPYPQVPMGWRKVTLEWDDGWWFLDFKDQPASCWHR